MPSRLTRFSKLAARAVTVLALVGCQRASEPLPSAAPSAERAPVNSATPTAAAAVSTGQQLYEQYCQLCHAKDGTGYAADNAPSLVSKTFLESASNAFIAQGIRLGRPNTAMAAYGKERGGPLSEPQIAELVAFLRSKGPSFKPLPELTVNGDAKRGAQVFAKSCQQCHGTAIKRGNAVHLHNAELLSAASPAFLQYAIVHGRPPTPMPAFQNVLAQREIDDVVAWLVSMKPAQAAAPVRRTDIPDDLPVVINPKGKHADFKLRDGRFVAADDVKKALDEKRRIVLVDARSPADWIQFRIPGAISLPYHDYSKLDRIPNDGTWVVAYCACPHHASGEVVDALKKRNYPNAAVLDEGILVWRERGYVLEGEAVVAPAKPGTPPVGKSTLPKPPGVAPKLP
jgi:cytochrome c oxidase cbb3-type subunit 3